MFQELFDAISGRADELIAYPDAIIHNLDAAVPRSYGCEYVIGDRKLHRRSLFKSSARESSGWKRDDGDAMIGGFVS